MTTKDEVREVQDLIRYYPTQYNGKPFMLPVGWVEELAEEVGKKVDSLLAKKREEIENLWQHAPKDGLPAMMAEGTLISRKQVLSILSN